MSQATQNNTTPTSGRAIISYPIFSRIPIIFRNERS